MTDTSREPYRPVLRTDADVTTMWRTLMKPLGWHNRRQYLVFVEADRRPAGVVVEVGEIPDTLTPDDIAVMVDFLADLPDHGIPAASVAILVCRPGSATLTDDDRALCREIYGAAARTGVTLELLHVGTDTAIVPAPMDEVLPRSA
jgi:hypothetical protein